MNSAWCEADFHWLLCFCLLANWGTLLVSLIQLQSCLHFYLAQIRQNAANDPQRFRSMWTRFHQPVVAVLSAGTSLMQISRSAILNPSAPVTHGPPASGQLFWARVLQLSGLEGRGVIIEDAGAQCFHTARLPRNALYVVCTSTSLKRQQDQMIPCCLHQFATLLSTCPGRCRDSSRQATVSNLHFQFWWAYANCGLGFLLSADRTGTWSGFMVIWISHLEILTCCAVDAFVYNGLLHTSVFALLGLVWHLDPARLLSSTLWVFTFSWDCSLGL